MNPHVSRRTAALMGTFVTIQVVGPSTSDIEDLIDRAFEWFREVEARCTRFDPASELMSLTAHAGAAVPVSDMLFEAVRFAVAVAEETEGAFDPTVGHDLESLGFNREHITGKEIRTIGPAEPATYRDVVLDPANRTIMLQRPLVLDLGAVAKGLAIDMAARELSPLRNFAIDAGGDLYLAGRNEHDKPWTVGIQHPRDPDAVVARLQIDGSAVCTSGDYERRSGESHHVLDARSRRSADTVASVTVVAPTAMAADALSTAAFALGPDEGLQLLERQGVDGLILSSTLERYGTSGFHRLSLAVLQDAEGPAHDRPGHSHLVGRVG